MDGALASLRAREAQLLGRRAQLLGLLRADRERFATGSRSSGGLVEAEAEGRPGAGADEQPMVAGVRGSAGGAAGSGADARASAGRPSQEVSRRTAQNLLLILGGLLLTVAAIVFIAVSWGHLGIAGRSAVLAAITGVTLAVPALLLRRGLTSTAETVGVLGLALTLLDGYAARRVGLLDSLSGTDYAAGAIGLTALVAAAYARIVRLTLPMPIAIVLIQVPLPLLAIDASRTWLTVALTATAALDAGVWIAAGRAAAARTRGLRVTAAVCLGTTGTIALMTGGYLTVIAETAGAALPHAGALVGLAAVGLIIALRVDDSTRVLPVVLAATALTLALSAPIRPLLRDGWQVLPYTAAALAVMALAVLLPSRLRTAGVASGGVLALVSVLPLAPEAAIVLLSPLSRLDEVWAGTAWLWGPIDSVRPATIAFALLALACAVLARWRRNPGALVFGTPAVMLVAVAYGLGYLPALAVFVALALLLTAVATSYQAATWAAGSAAAQAVAWSLAMESATYVTLGVLFAAWAILYRRPAALTGAVLSGGGLMWALLAGAGLPVLDSCAVGLAVAAALALAAGYVTPPAKHDDDRPSGRTEEVWSPRTFGHGLAVVLATLSVLPVIDAVASVLGSYVPAFTPWRGLPQLVEQRLLVAPALALSGAVLTLVTRPAAAAVAGSIVVAVVPVTVPMPYPLVLALLVAGTAAAAAVATRNRVGAGAALWLGSLAIGWALAFQWATLAVLPALALVAGASAVLGRARFAAMAIAGLLVAGEAVAVARAMAVEAVEAYTLPFALVLLALGWWRTRSRQISSWPVYGPGLALAFGPSLLAEAGSLRSLLLGIAALAVTLAGARGRLQAPAVLGGLTLAAVTLRELAPWIAELVGVVPRWVPIAVGGLLLLVVGATYEARKRDLIRLKDAVARLR
ncbi:SCO7613 C-terminal domain-containing membrane protein [Nonomuraea sp. 3N208]